MPNLFVPQFVGGAAAVVIVVVALPAAWWAARVLRSRRGNERRGTAAVRVAALAAVGCTAYSADTSWRFAADYLDMSSTIERAAMFGAAELALFATALMARQNLNGPQGAPGVPGVLVWVITGIQIIPAYAESGPVGGTVRAFVGPVMAAMLWHLAMGIELRHHTPDSHSQGLAAVLGRELRERIFSRLGIAERNRDAAQITRDRATDRAVALAARLAELPPQQRGRRSGRRIARRLSIAVGRASVGTDAEQRHKLLDQLAARRHAVALATVDLPSPWEAVIPGPDPAASHLAAQVRGQMRDATDSIRRQHHPQFLFENVSPTHEVNSREGAGRSPEHRDPTPQSDKPPSADEPHRLGTAEAKAAIEDGWTRGLTVRETAQRATRAISYVHSEFVKLENERGPRPAAGQIALINGHDTPRDQREDAEEH